MHHLSAVALRACRLACCLEGGGRPLGDGALYGGEGKVAIWFRHREVGELNLVVRLGGVMLNVYFEAAANLVARGVLA